MNEDFIYTVGIHQKKDCANTDKYVMLQQEAHTNLAPLHSTTLYYLDNLAWLSISFNQIHLHMEDKL